MTRKRKIEAATTNKDDLNALAGYGNCEAAETLPSQTKNGIRGKSDQESAGTAEESTQPKETQMRDAPRFPTELVRYLEQMAREEPDEDVAHLHLAKCFDEIKGREELLMKYAEGCFAVESIFSRTRAAAFEFLKRLQQSKQPVRVGFLFATVASRTLERLFEALVPIQGADAEFLTSWLDLIIDNWQDVVFDRSAAHVPRTLGRVLIGDTKSQSGDASAPAAKQKLPKFASQLLSRLLTRAFDFTTMQANLNVLSVSLVLQDLAAVERVAQTGCCQEFVKRFLDAAASGNAAVALRAAWQQRNAARVWESMLKTLDSEQIEKIFACITSDEAATIEKQSNEEQIASPSSPQLLAIARDAQANFPLQALFRVSTITETIAQKVAATLVPHFVELIDESKPWIIVPALATLRRCVADEETKCALQTSAVRSLRRQFGAHGRNKRAAFLPNLLTLNNANLETTDEAQVTFDVDNSQAIGAIIVAELVQFSANETLLASFSALSTSTLQSMAQNAATSHIFDSLAHTPTINEETKWTLFGRIDMNALCTDKFGSRVFESIWYELKWPIDRRESVVRDVLMPHFADKVRDRFANILLFKLDIAAYRKSANLWRSRLGTALQRGREQRVAETATRASTKCEPLGAADKQLSTAPISSKKRRKQFGTRQINTAAPQ